jgi:putative aminopeptidase FrvX
MTDERNGNHVEDGAREATDEERTTGIVDQVRGDAARGNEEDVVRLLRQRLEETGIVVTDDRFEALVLQVRGATDV